MSSLPGMDRRADRRMVGWLQGGGEMGAMIGSHDWSGTSLGPIDDWPHTLRTTLNLILNSRFSTFVGWGPDLLCFYNDAYLPSLQGKVDTLGKPLADVFPEAMERVEPLFAAALAGKATFMDTLCVPIRKGDKIQDSWWAVSYSPIRDETGAICGVFVPVYEETDRIQAESRLRESEANLRRFSEIVPSMLWRSSPDGSLIWCNRQLSEELETDDVLASVHPDDRPALSDTWEQSQRDHTTFRNYHRLRMRGGQYRWHLAMSEPQVDASGEAIEWFGVATDVDDLHQATTALAQASALFSAFAENSADAIWVIDANTLEAEYTSPACQTIWGEVPESRFDWNYWLSSIHPDDRAQREASFDRLMAGEVLREQYRIVRSDGSVRWIRDTMFPIMGQDNLVRMVGCIAEDITQSGGRIVHLIDGGPEARLALTRRLHTKGYDVRSYDSVDSFVRVCRGLLPGCVMFIERDGRADAQRLAGALKGEFYAFPLLLVGDVGDASAAIQLMKQGIKDIILPSDPPERLDQAVAAALSTVRKDQRENDAVRRAKERIQTLSDREREVLLGLSDGATNKTLARDLGVSPRTVETHRVHIMEKLGVATLPEAAKIVALAQL